MGLRQRLSLAVAVLHEPQILILDEPTSGVDPVARDSFWELLIDLSRKQGVTIFVTTHFMNEGMRCDRISLMNAGKVLACDAPQKLIDERGAASLEEAFIGYMEDAHRRATAAGGREKPAPAKRAAEARRRRRRLRPQPAAHVEAVRAGACASAGCSPTRATRRMQILRDPVRLAFAFVGSALLMLVCGFGITTDVEHIRYATFDLDQSPESRAYLEQFAAIAALLHPDPAGQLRRRGARAAAIGRRLDGPRDPAQLRPGPPPGLRAGGPGPGGRRDDLPRRDRRAIRQGRPRQRCSRIPRPGLPTAVPQKYTADIEEPVHVQPHVREHLLDRAERPGPAAAPDPGDPHDGQHRAREGARLDDQLLRHAHGQAGVPARQAAPVHRHRHDQLLHPGRSCR